MMTLEQKKLLSNYKTNFPGMMTETIADLLLNSPSIDEDCQLAWQECFIGGTGYLDQIRPQDLKKPIMWGIDKWGRLYITIKTKLSPDPSKPVIEQSLFQWCMNSVTNIFNRTPPARLLGTETYFQRFSDMGSIWHVCSHYSHGVPIITIHPDNDINLDGLRDLLKNGHIFRSVVGIDNTIYYKVECA